MQESTDTDGSIDPVVGVWRGVSVRTKGNDPKRLPILFQMNLDQTYEVTVLGPERSLTFGKWERRRDSNVWVGRSIYMIIPDRVCEQKFLAEGVINLRIDVDNGDEVLRGCFKRTTEPFEALGRPQFSQNEIEGTITAVRVDLSLDDVPSDLCEIPDPD